MNDKVIVVEGTAWEKFMNDGKYHEPVHGTIPSHRDEIPQYYPNDQVILHVTIPRWVEEELRDINISQILTDYCTPPTKEQIQCVKCMTTNCRGCKNDECTTQY